MNMMESDRLSVTEVADGILLISQINPPTPFCSSAGLLALPRPGRNRSTVALDISVEPDLVRQIVIAFGPVKEYVCTHGHMSHIANVHAWERLGARIHAPLPESNYLSGLKYFYRGFELGDVLTFPYVESFARVNGFRPCGKVKTFRPGDVLKLDGLQVETVSFKGHSRAHVGLLLPGERVFHITSLGFDGAEGGTGGFGPRYGYKQCSIRQYLRDIELAEEIFNERADVLTSSHGRTARRPDSAPFAYMRGKIQAGQEKVEEAVRSLRPAPQSDEETVLELLKMDLFFPQKKDGGFFMEMYNFWEYWMIRNHLKRG